MPFKNKEQAIKYLIKKHLKAQDNVLLCERLFQSHSILEWIFSTTNNLIVVKSYMSDLEKYIQGELDLKWVEQILNKRKKKSHDNKKSKTEKKSDKK